VRSGLQSSRGNKMDILNEGKIDFLYSKNFKLPEPNKKEVK
jgi:hypothetical protein